MVKGPSAAAPELLLEELPLEELLDELEEPPEELLDELLDELLEELDELEELLDELLDEPPAPDEPEPPPQADSRVRQQTIKMLPVRGSDAPRNAMSPLLRIGPCRGLQSRLRHKCRSEKEWLWSAANPGATAQRQEKMPAHCNDEAVFRA